MCLDAGGKKTITNEFAARARGLSVTEELPKSTFNSLILKGEKRGKVAINSTGRGAGLDTLEAA